MRALVGLFALTLSVSAFANTPSAASITAAMPKYRTLSQRTVDGRQFKAFVADRAAYDTVELARPSLGFYKVAMVAKSGPYAGRIITADSTNEVSGDPRGRIEFKISRKQK